ncbi:hypothetical protein LTR84_003138 [Exophiala bonariae]|uniref:Uncharacterized protein n=1 Tax=Exophiala bonariae TaxID=1690606 RepID=A0AAV9N876_9EURO|nr:hypothetical protein LTR84_003138 [Exophiala bonariae]
MHLSSCLGDIPSRRIPKLANILQFRPKENHHDQEERIKSTIKTLPTRLRGPGRLIRLLLHPRIDACEWHKGLNRCVTDVILHSIQIEIGIRLNSLIAHSEMLPKEHFDRVSRLRELHALWLGPETFEKTFLIPTQNVPWKYQANKCDACILSCLAGNMQTLLDLRCVISSRATSKFVAKHGNPRLLTWVDAWIKSLVTHVRDVTGLDVPLDAQIEKNDHQAVELKNLRGKIRRLQKKRYHSAGPHRAMVDNSVDAAIPVQAIEADDRIFVDNGEEIVSSKQARRQSMGDNDEDSGDADLASVDAFTALKSSSHVPLVLDPCLQYGNPYCPDEAELRHSVHSDIGNNGKKSSILQPDIYVPPRQGWKKQEAIRHSTAARSHQPTVASRRESWESVVFDSNFVESGIMHQSRYESRQTMHQPHHRSARPPSSRYPSVQTEFASRRPTVVEGGAYPDPAASYVNVLPVFGEYDVEAGHDRNGNKTHYQSTTASGSQHDATIKSSSVLPAAKAHAPPRHTRPDAIEHVKGVDKKHNTAQDLLHAYDDLAQGLGKHNAKIRSKPSTHNHLASDLNISSASRNAMVPESLKAPRRHDDHKSTKQRTEHRVDGHSKPDTAHRGEKKEKHGEDHCKHGQRTIPVAHDAAKAKSPHGGDDDKHKHTRDADPAEKKDKTKVKNDRTPVKHNYEDRSNPHTKPTAPAKPAKNQESNATTWSAQYGAGLRGKDDLTWFYNGGRK